MHVIRNESAGIDECFGRTACTNADPTTTTKASRGGHLLRPIGLGKHGGNTKLWDALRADARFEQFYVNPVTKAYRLVTPNNDTSGERQTLNELKERVLAYLVTQKGQSADACVIGTHLSSKCLHLFNKTGPRHHKLWEALDADPRLKMYHVNLATKAYRLVTRVSDKSTSNKQERLEKSKGTVDAHLAAQKSEVAAASSRLVTGEADNGTSEERATLNEIKDRVEVYLAAQAGQCAEDNSIGSFLITDYGHLLSGLTSEGKNQKLWGALDADPRFQMFHEENTKAYRLVTHVPDNGKSDKHVRLEKAKGIVGTHLATQRSEVAAASSRLVTGVPDNCTPDKQGSIKKIKDNGAPDKQGSLKKIKDIAAAYLAAQVSEEATAASLGEHLCKKYGHLLTAIGNNHDNKKNNLSTDEEAEGYEESTPAFAYPYRMAMDEEREEDEGSTSVHQFEMTMPHGGGGGGQSSIRELRPLPLVNLSEQDGLAYGNAGSGTATTDDDVETILAVMPTRLQEALRPHSQGPKLLMEVAEDAY
eukprot:gene3318-13347_t